MRAPSTGLLVWLAFILPLVALLAAQFAIACDEGDCSAPELAFSWLVLPLIVAWLAVLVALVIRTVRR